MRITAEFAEKIKVPTSIHQSDYSGMKRGRLTFIHCTNWTVGPHVNWVAKCECGSLALLTPYSSTKSCGCLRVENSRKLKAALSDDQIREIRASKEKCIVLAAIYGVSHCTISSIRTGRRYSHVQ